MTKPTTPLCQRMTEDMPIRKMSPLTQAAYVRAVANFAIHHGVSPDRLPFEDVAMKRPNWNRMPKRSIIAEVAGEGAAFTRVCCLVGAEASAPSQHRSLP